MVASRDKATSMSHCVRVVSLVVLCHILLTHLFYTQNKIKFMKNGGFIKEAILGVRTYCIDEIALASNALTNHGLKLSAI